MKHRLHRGLLALGLLSVLFAPGALAQSQVNIYLDFDDDGDPWTLRSAMPEGILTGTVKFVLDVVALPLPSGEFTAMVEEGCCDGPYYDGHYGTSVAPETVVFDPLFVTDVQLAFPTCTYCCPWILTGNLASTAPVVTGQRYFIGQADWNAYCTSEVCTPPTDFVMTFSDPIGGGGTMSFTCPPTVGEPFSWGRIRSLYR